jgi:hypothetical protein
MLEMFRLIPAIQIIFSSKIEFSEVSFADMTQEQQEAFERQGLATGEKFYRIVVFEPEAIERTDEKVTWELTIVSEAEKQLLLDGVAFVHRESSSLNQSNPSFEDRLEYLRPRLPPSVTTQAPNAG